MLEVLKKMENALHAALADEGGMYYFLEPTER
ncbi:MAG: hypothetical protein M2R45_00241 [Verrucomicrobia subdivision 3 bacterium]|nr:hypothetical protein [Limisphaerales bacterium]